jgi:hypothetical protein
MEQNMQQTVENKLPIKAKVFGLTMKIIGVGLIAVNIVYLLLCIFSRGAEADVQSIAIVSLFFFLILSIPFGISLFSLGNKIIIGRKKWAWSVSIVLLFIASLWLLYYGIFVKVCFICGILLLILVVIFFLDRKNFWKVAR